MRTLLIAALTVIGCSTPDWQPEDSDLLFSSNAGGNGEIYLIAAGSTDWVNLTRSPENENNPVWTSDGTRILYQRTAAGSKIDIWIMNADGSDARPVMHGPDHEYLPTEHPDSRRLTYVHRVPDSTGTEHPVFYIADLYGEGVRPFSRAPLNTSAGVTWLSDGVSFVTTIVRDSTGGDLYRYDGEDAAGVQLTSLPGYEVSPTVSPDGQWLAFYHDPGDGTSRLEICRIDGSDRRSLVADGLNFLPDWSPDGRWIVFVRQADPAVNSDLDLYVVPVDGSAPPRPLVDGPDRESEGSFRPTVSSD